MRFKFIFLVAFVFITVSISGCATPAPRGELQEALASFEKQVARADQAIFFYAGHSLQINGENYLMPVEFEPRQKTEQIQSSSVPEPLGSKIKKKLRTQRARSITSGS